MPLERVHFATRNYDEATEFVRQTYFDDRLRVAAGNTAGEFETHRDCVGTALAADHIRSTFGFSFHSAPVEYVAVCQIRHGVLQQLAGDEDLVLTGGDVFLARPWVSLTSAFSRFAMQGVRLPMAAVEDLAATQADIDSADLRFHSGRPVSAAMARYWRATLALVVDELGVADAVFANPLVAEQMQRHLAAAVLAAFPNTTTTIPRHGPSGSVAPAAVRRAAAYIEAHAGEPIRLTDIANAAGTRPRALQYAFNRHHGTTPVGYLTRVRLEGAHRDLQAADPSHEVAVAAIARRWGFASLSGFGVVYRVAYGHPPDHTLRS